MNRQERRRWMRRHVATELAARSSRERLAPVDGGDPRRDFVPEQRPFVLAFELAEEEPAAPKAPATNGTPPAPEDATSEAGLLQGAAERALKAGEPIRAREILRELVVREPTNFAARRRLAEVLEAGGDLEAALEELEPCVAVKGDSASVIARAALLGKLRRFAEAERDLRGVLRAEPASAEAHFRLGLVISKKGLWREAVPYLRRAVELDSARAAAHHYLGEALNHVDDLDGALQSFQRANELRPNNADTLYGLGIVLDRLNRPDDAAQMYRRSRELAGR